MFKKELSMKIFLSVIILLVIYGIGASYYRSFVSKNFEIISENTSEPINGEEAY